MKTTIEELIFPESIKTKLKIKVSWSNLKVEYINGHIIKFNKTNLSIIDPHKIIISNIKFNTIFHFGFFFINFSFNQNTNEMDRK